MPARLPTREPPEGSRERSATALVRASGALGTAAAARMDDDFAWFGELRAEERSWVGQIVQAGVRAFIDWYRGGEADAPGSFAVAASVFGAAPRALTGTISLQQTVDLVRLAIEVVETEIDVVLEPVDVPAVRAAVLRYAREVAFATAAVYARAAESRGAWDARLEALVVDAVVRAESDASGESHDTVLSRASALGWTARASVVVVVGTLPEPDADEALFDVVRRAAGSRGAEALCAAQGERLVVVLGGVEDPRSAAAPLAALFGAGPVVVGPPTPDLAHAHVSAREALAAHRAASGWPDAPRPVMSDDLLPERALAGDEHARRHLLEEVYGPLRGARGALVESLAAYLAEGGAIEATARGLFVHPNTVRYRLRQVADLTGLTPGVPRDALTLQVALVLGRQSGR